MVKAWAEDSPDLARLDGFDMLTDPTDDNIRVRLQTNKIWEADATKIVLEKFKGGVFVDVGAHWGYYSLLVARLAERVYALEPERDAFRLLCLNIALNGFENITPLPLAAWNSNMELTTNKIGGNTGGTGMSHEPNVGNLTIQRPMGVKLDDLVEGADFIKIDCEGTDGNVIKGAERLIKESHPQMLIESPPKDVLEGWGYREEWSSGNSGQGNTSLWVFV